MFLVQYQYLYVYRVYMFSVFLLLLLLFSAIKIELSYLPTPPLGQDVIQGQFLSEV